MDPIFVKNKPVKGIALVNPTTGEADHGGRPPVLCLVSGVNPVTPGGDKAGWVSGDLKNLPGGFIAGNQGGFVAGAATFSSGAITAIAITSGGTGLPTTAKLELTIVGNGTGARAYAFTNSSGTVTSIVMISGGTGYTTMTSAVIATPASATSVIFDLGPRFAEYTQAEFAIFSQEAGTIYQVLASAQTTELASSYVGYMVTPSNSESYFSSMGTAGVPVRMFYLAGTRFVRFACYPGILTGNATAIRLTARP